MKLLISGYYGMRNSGDDALLLTTASFLNRDKSRKMFSTSGIVPNLKLRNKPVEVTPIYPKVNRFKGHSLMYNLRNFNKFDYVVFGGGSVLHDSFGIKKKIFQVKSAKKGGIVVGVGVGPFTKVKDEKACKKFLDSCNFISVRDKNSYDIAQSLTRNNVVLANDIVPSLYEHLELPNTKGQRCGVGFSLCDYESYIGKNTDVEIERRIKLAKIIEYITLDLKEPVYLYTFNGHDKVGDYKINKDIFEMLNPQAQLSVKIISYIDNPERYFQLLSNLRVTISMRLHCSVFSLMTHTPNIMLSYHPKCDEWSKLINGFESRTFSSSSFEVDDIVNSLNTTFENQSTIIEQLNVKQIVNSSMKNWEFLKQL